MERFSLSRALLSLRLTLQAFLAMGKKNPRFLASASGVVPRL
jgi:hypothetical protein